MLWRRENLCLVENGTLGLVCVTSSYGDCVNAAAEPLVNLGFCWTLSNRILLVLRDVILCVSLVCTDLS